MHLMLTPFDYELFLDVKKLGKMSLAKIIDCCMEKYFLEFIDVVLETKNTDNYLYASYHCEISYDYDTFSYHVYWEIPPHILYKVAKTS